MTLEDLQALYDLAKAAPLTKALYAKQVAALFEKVEAELSKGAAALAMEQAKQHLERIAPPVAG